MFDEESVLSYLSSDDEEVIDFLNCFLPEKKQIYRMDEGVPRWFMHDERRGKLLGYFSREHRYYRLKFEGCVRFLESFDDIQSKVNLRGIAHRFATKSETIDAYIVNCMLNSIEDYKQKRKENSDVQ